MAVKQTFIDKILQHDNVTTVRRLIIGGLLAASALSGSIGIIAAVSAASIGLNAVVMRHEKTIQHKKLLNFYEDEIAALQHTSPDALTLGDLQQVAAPVEQGGKGIETLRKELKGLNIQQAFRITDSSISSIITTGILAAICFFHAPFLAGGGMSMVLGLGLIGLGYTVIAKTVKATSEAIFGSHDMDDSVQQRLMRIAEEIKEKPANAVEIFGLFVDSNPDLAKQIQYHFKIDYADLPVIRKKQIVEAYEPEFRVISLTNAMNNGSIKPSLVGLIASADVSDELPGFRAYRELFNTPLQKISDASFELAANDVNLSDYRKRIINERELAPGSKSLH